jgi:undecaprenyl-diphosphatase
MNALDIALFLHLNATADSPQWAITAAVWASSYLSTLAMGLLIPLVFLGPRARWQVLGVVLTMVMAWLLARGLRETIASVRPFVMGVGQQWLDHSAGPGFPSMHATMAAAWAAGLTAFAPMQRRWMWAAVCVPVALAIAMSRVYLGVHFPSDIALGLLIGAVMSVLALVLAARTPLRRWAPAHPQQK